MAPANSVCEEDADRDIKQTTLKEPNIYTELRSLNFILRAVRLSGEDVSLE